MKFTRPRWIVFDAADTLLQPTPNVATVYHRVALAHGIRTTVADISQRFAPAIRKHFRDDASSEERDRKRWQSLVFDVLETDNKEVFHELWEHFAMPTSWHLFDDVELTWNWLVEHGFLLSIASNFDARLLSIVSAMPPIDSASNVFISSRLGYRKPSRNFFAAIQRQLDCPPGELLLVGDSKHADFDGAKNAGWQALHLDRTSCEPNLPVICTLATLTTLLPYHPPGAQPGDCQ